MSTEKFHGVQGGQPLVGLRSASVEVWLAPALGGRVLSLRDRAHNREWIWTPPVPAPLRPSALGDSFEDSGHAGIDECLPTIGACLWRDRALPDHGEVWCAAWRLEGDSPSDTVSLRVSLPVSPFEFARSLRLVDDTLELSYRLTNRGRSEEEFLWAWHPLFGLRDGDRLELPPMLDHLRVGVFGGDPPLGPGAAWTLPATRPKFDVERLQLGRNAGEYLKAFGGPLPPGPVSVSLRGKSGETLSISWDAAENPWLGLWLSRGYRGWHHVALEPSNGAPDRLDEAVRQWCAHGRLPAGETRAWSIRVRLSRG